MRVWSLILLAYALTACELYTPVTRIDPNWALKSAGDDPDNIHLYYCWDDICGGESHSGVTVFLAGIDERHIAFAGCPYSSPGRFYEGFCGEDMKYYFIPHPNKPDARMRVWAYTHRVGPFTQEEFIEQKNILGLPDFTWSHRVIN